MFLLMLIHFVRGGVSGFLCLDPEVRIALENLQQFPAFSSASGEAAGTEVQSNDLLSPLGRSPVSQPGEQLRYCTFSNDVSSTF